MPERKPQPNSRTYSLDALHMFPYFATREAFKEATGVEPPPFDDSKPPKYWRDLGASKVDVDDVVVYDVAYRPGGGVLTATDGTPRFVKLIMSPTDALAINIPDKKIGSFQGSGRVTEVQPPLFPLLPNERLTFQPGIAGAQLMIQRIDIATPATPTSWTEGDRQLLREIANRLGVA
jgi:hypothetical protein